METRKKIALMLCMALLLAACGCTQEKKEEKPTTSVRKVTTTTKVAATTMPVTTARAGATSSTSTSTSSTTSTSTTSTTTTTSTSTSSTSSTTTSSTTSTTTSSMRPDVLVSLSTDRGEYGPGDVMAIKVGLDSRRFIRDAVVNVFGVDYKSRYALDMSGDYVVNVGLTQATFTYTVPRCNETMCLPSGAYKIYADISQDGRILARAEGSVNLTNKTKEAVARKVDASLSTDKDVYNAGDLIGITLTANSSTDISGVEVKVYGIKTTHNRLSETRNVDLVAGANNLTFSYQLPDCNSCSGISAGNYVINADLFLNGRILARTEKSVFING